MAKCKHGEYIHCYVLHSDICTGEGAGGCMSPKILVGPSVEIIDRKTSGLQKTAPKISHCIPMVTFD